MYIRVTTIIRHLNVMLLRHLKRYTFLASIFAFKFGWWLVNTVPNNKFIIGYADSKRLSKKLICWYPNFLIRKYIILICQSDWSYCRQVRDRSQESHLQASLTAESDKNLGRCMAERKTKWQKVQSPIGSRESSWDSKQPKKPRLEILKGKNTGHGDKVVCKLR